MSDVRSDRFFCLASNSSSLRFCLFLASLRFLQPTMPSASSLAVEFNDPWIFRIFSLVATSFCATFPLDEDEFPIFFSVTRSQSVGLGGTYHMVNKEDNPRSWAESSILWMENFPAVGNCSRHVKVYAHAHVFLNRWLVSLPHNKTKKESDMLGVALGIPRLGRKRSSIVNSVSRVIVTMSGWKDDPIVLSSSSSSDEGSVASSADLNDDQFELVKARFNALRPQYEGLWRSLLAQNKENTPSGGVAKDSDNVPAADAEEVRSML